MANNSHLITKYYLWSVVQYELLGRLDADFLQWRLGFNHSIECNWNKVFLEYLCVPYKMSLQPTSIFVCHYL